MTILLLEHHHILPGCGHVDVKLIGAFSSLGDLEAARERVRGKPGFASVPDGFRIQALVLRAERSPVAVWLAETVVTEVDGCESARFHGVFATEGEARLHMAESISRGRNAGEEIVISELKTNRLAWSDGYVTDWLPTE